MLKVALAGNPNCGKTTLFNALTGSTAHVGNWPGVTVERRSGVYNKKGDNPIEIVDLPGIYSLSPYTPEEVISRNYIIDGDDQGKPDCVINIVDASNLERNLYLTTQLMEMNIPVVVALNMMDILEKNGDILDSEKLSQVLGVPVVPVSALKETNIQELMEITLEEGSKERKGCSVLENCKVWNIINEVKDSLINEDVTHALYHAIKIVENDSIEIENHKNETKIVENKKQEINDEIFGNDLEAIVADTRYKFIQNNCSTCLTKAEVKVETDKNGKVKEKLTKSDKIDKVLTHRVIGLIIFAVVLFLIFHLTFGEDLFYLGAMGVFGEGKTPFLEGTAWEGLLFTGSSIQSPGVFLQSCLTGLTDWLTELTRNGLDNLGASNWAIALVCDGLEAGIFSVLSFLPQILLLFAFFAFLEDSGYMARVAFILDRMFRKFGVTGRAFMPMIMGFGCSVPAMTNTRTLATERERIATIRVIPFFSCSAKLPILTACAGAIVTQFGFKNADLITYGMYLTGIVVAIFAIILMRNTTLKGETAPFIMELPSYRLPKFKALLLHVWDKGKHFVKKAFTIILVSNLVIWFLQSFTPSLQFIEYDEEIGFLTELTTNDSILANIGRSFQFLFTPLGFGSQLGSFGWVFAVGAITGLIAKENVIATFAMLGAVVGNLAIKDPDFAGTIEGATDVARMISATGINAPGLLAFIVFNMTTIPCFAAVATAKAELKKGTLKNTIAFWLIASYVSASAFYLIGTWWWTVFIYIALIALVIICIVLKNKKEAKKLNLNK